MNEGFTESVVERTRAAFREGLSLLMAQCHDRLVESISVPVEHTNYGIIRSNPGEPPRRESGDLIESVRSGLETDADGTLTEAMYVQPTMWYAVVLEHGGHGSWGAIAPRPFVEPERERTFAEAVEVISSQMKL